MDNLLDIRQVSKSYGEFIAVNEFNLTIPKGMIFGLLGPNGAGKTSLIRMITGITQADSGSILFKGQTITSQLPESIGYLPEERGLYKKMKVGDHLEYLLRLKGMSKDRIESTMTAWLDRFNLTEWRKKNVNQLSKGMQQKVQFIATVAHDPELLILDEPFSGLDPINTNLIKEEILRLANNGTTIIFSTHRMEQVETMCEHIALVNQGRNVLEGDVYAIKHQFKQGIFQLEYTGDLSQNARAVLDILDEKKQRITINGKQGQSAREILQLLLNESIEITRFEEVLPSLNDIFISQVQSSTNA